MINKEKITKADIYDENGNLLLSTKSVTFPRDFFKLKGLELVSIKGSDLPIFHKDDKIKIIFEYINGTRLECHSGVDISTDKQLNFHVGEGIVLEERRRSFKVTTVEPAFIMRIERNEEVFDLETKKDATILNINLGGVLLKSDAELVVGDIIDLSILPDPMYLRAKILRKQTDSSGELIGYGCCFLDVTTTQEERLARYLLECQLAERDRRRNEGR